MNRRAKVAEHSLVYLKILGVVHLVLGAALLCLDGAKLLLLWNYLTLFEQKMLLGIRTFYAVYVVLLGFGAILAGFLNRKGMTQLLVVSMLVMLVPVCLLFDKSPVVQSGLIFCALLLYLVFFKEMLHLVYLMEWKTFSLLDLQSLHLHHVEEMFNYGGRDSALPY